MSQSASRSSPSRAQQGIQTRQRILSTALELFSERGYDGVSLRMIGDAVGVNHAMIRYYFDNKAKLWEAAIDFLFERIEREVSQHKRAALAAGELNAKERAKVIVRAYIHYCARHPEHARIMIRENICANDRLQATSQYIARHHAAVAPVLESWIKAKLVPDISVVSLTYAIAGMSQLPFALASEVKAVHGIDINTQSAIDAHCDTVIKLLFRDDD